MLDPFDKEFISQELRDAWRKIEHLEEENKKLQEENKRLRYELYEEWEDDREDW